jgi:hypothetical protein
MAGRNTLEGQTIRVLDTDGTPLTWAVAGATEGDGAVTLDKVDEPSVLITYYFGRGERLVLMELPDFPQLTVEGTLETWWRGHERTWQVYVDRPLVKIGPAGSAHPEPAGSR